MNIAKLSKFHKAQISYLQQAIWDLEKARANITFATGNSAVGKNYIENVDILIENIQEDIDNIWDQYSVGAEK